MKTVFDKMKQTLQADLVGFGLNPQEWVLNETDSELISRQKYGDEHGVVRNIWIQHARDKNFRFKGEASFEIKKNLLKADWVRMHLDPAI